MKKILVKGIILIFVVGVLLTSQVMAYSFKMTATPSTTALKEGETVTITLGIKDIDAGELGINTLEAQLAYDPNIFEVVKQEDIKSTNNWSITYNGENNGGKLLGVILASGVKDDQNSIGTINLKVKSGIRAKETTIKFSGITTNDGTTLITDVDKEIKLTVENASTPIEENIPNTSNTTNEGNSINTVVQTNPKDTTTSEKIIPATGIKKAIIIISICVLIITAILCRIMIKKMN